MKVKLNIYFLMYKIFIYLWNWFIISVFKVYMKMLKEFKKDNIEYLGCFLLYVSED